MKLGCLSEGGKDLLRILSKLLQNFVDSSTAVATAQHLAPDIRGARRLHQRLLHSNQRMAAISQ